MSTETEQAVQLRKTWLGNVKGEDVVVLQELLTRTQQELQETRRRATRELEEHAARIASLLGTLKESVGWSHRLPVALSELTRLVAGRAERDGLFERLARAVHEVVGAHLLASVTLSTTDWVAQASQHTERDGAAGPLYTSALLGDRAISGTWEPAADPSVETVEVVEALCAAALCSLAGLAEAEEREQRGVVTQLGDAHAHARHLALRERLGQATGELSVAVREESAGEKRSLFGRIAWQASFADVGATLEEIAHRYGGQTYQLGPYSFWMLIDRDCATQAQAEVEERLRGSELDFDIHLGV